MSKQTLSDAGVGRALFTTRLQLSLQAGYMCLLFGALPGFLLPLLSWWWLVPRFDVDLVRFAAVSQVVSADSPHRWHFRDHDDERSTLTVPVAGGGRLQWMTADQARQVLGEDYRSAVQEFQWALVAAVGTSVLGFVMTLKMLRRLGSGSQQNQRLRGADLIVSGSELGRRVRREGGGAYQLVEVALPASAPMSGILVEGAQSSGKSLAIHDLMRQVMAKGRKCVIFDQSGEYFRAYYRPGKDLFFNPSLEGSVSWSIFAELRRTYDADSLAQAFLPPKAGVVSGAGAFFEDAARAVFSALLLRLAEAGAVDTRDIADAVLRMPAEQMDYLIRNTVASSAVAGDSKTQRQGVISSIAIYLSGIAAVRPGRWSLRDFIDGPDDTRLFIVGTEDTKAMFAPLYRLLLTVAFSTIAAKADIVHTDRYWFFLDEVHELGDIKLDAQLALLRKFGVCIVTGIQSDSQVVASIGRDRAETVANCFNTALLLRANEPAMQERVAKRLGKVEMDTVTRNQALAVAEWRDGAGLNKSEHEKWLVMPAEVGSLASCCGWLKLVGDYPAAKVDYRHWLPRRPGAHARVDRFRPIQDLPVRDPTFELTCAQSANALASVQAEFETEKARQAKAAASPQASASAAPAAAASSSPAAAGQAGSSAPVRFSMATANQVAAEATKVEPVVTPDTERAASASGPGVAAPTDLLGVEQPLQSDVPQRELGL